MVKKKDIHDDEDNNKVNNEEDSDEEQQDEYIEEGEDSAEEEDGSSDDDQGDYAEEDDEGDEDSEDSDEEEGLDSGAPDGVNPNNKRVIVFALLGVAFLLLIYTIFGGGGSDDKSVKVVNNSHKTEDKKDDNNNIVDSMNIESFNIDSEMGPEVSSIIPDNPTDPPPLVVPEVAPTPPVMEKKEENVAELLPPSLPSLPADNNLNQPILSPPVVPPTVEPVINMPPVMGNGTFGGVNGYAAAPNSIGPVNSPPEIETIDMNSESGPNFGANMIAIDSTSGSGGGAGGSTSGGGLAGLSGGDPLSAAQGLVGNMTGTSDRVTVSDFAPPQHTSSSQVMATSYGNRDTMIAQGKIIDVVLETALNTSMPGYVRAIVTRDVYSEQGNNVLIPKGSRIVGDYTQSGNKVGRIDITWNRVMRSDGIDIVVDSKAIDSLGRGGVEGEVDMKIAEAIRNALLVSSISIGTTAMASKIIGGDNSTTTTTNAGNGTQTTVSSPTDSAIQGAAQQMQKRLADAITSKSSSDPVVKIDQGSRLKVFVNKDIVFSRSVANLNSRRSK